MDVTERLRRYKRDRSGYAEYCHQAADEIDRLRKQRDFLLSAARRTLAENAHLADGDVCTLLVLKRAVEALAKVGAGRTAHNAKAVGLDAAGGQSRTSDGLCTGAGNEERTGK